MAMLRGSSLPPGGTGGANPFWSSRAQGEWRLRAERPIDLPVPGEDEETRRELEEGDLQPLTGGARPAGDRGRSSVSGRPERRSRSRVSGEMDAAGVFVTPPSGTMTGKGRGAEPGGGLRTAGRMPPEMEDEQPTSGTESSGSKEAQDALRRALERGVVEQLHEENMKLKCEMNELMKKIASGQVSSGWSEVTEEKRSKEDYSPVRVNTSSAGLDLPRFTPNGTRVPSGPPPMEEGDNGGLPELPKWPFPLEMNYEAMEQSSRSRFMQLGGEPVKLRGQVHQGGRDSRQEQDGGVCRPGHGARSRHGQDGHFSGDGRGTHPQPSREAQGTMTDVMSSMQARTFWLEQELKSMKSMLDRQESAKMQSDYWKQPVTRHDRDLGGVDYGGDCHQVPLSRASHGGLCHQAPLSRAEHGGVYEQAPQGRADGDRPQGSGRALHGTVLGVQRPHGKEYHGDPEGQRHGDDLFDGCYQADRQGHQQLHNRGPGDHEEQKRSVEKGPEKENEALRSNNPVLPLLPAVSQKNSAVDAADWLVEIRPTIGDLSTSAGSWWSATTTATLEVYKRWLAATPLERLRIAPPEPVDSTKFGNGLQIQRLEQRVTTILMPSLPAELRHDLISARQLWPCAILYRILRSYQPGGWGERSMLLTELTMTAQASSAADASTKLRMWRRHRSRALELGATLPDVLLQVRALDVVVQGILKQHPQTQFRIASYRMEANIDERPTDETLAQFLELLTAEMDTLQTGTTEASGGSVDKAGASVKMLKSSGSSPCKFWGSEYGCQKGKQCAYQHDWQSLEDRASRCFVCSSLHHRKSECPVKSSVDSQTTEGGSGQGRGSQPKGSGKSDGKSTKGGKDFTKDKEKGGNGKGKTKTRQEETPTTKSMSTTTPAVVVEESGKGHGEGRDPGNGKDNNSDGGTGSVEAATLMSEVTSLLKSMRTGGKPQVSAVRLQRLDTTGQKTVLLDGGATHCLRPMRSEEEWEKAVETPVFLASGTVTLRQVPGSETLITRDKGTQPIVPLAALVQLGIQVRWDEQGCEMKRPDGSKLPIYLDGGCPVMERWQGMELMAEVEFFNSQKSGIRNVIATRRLDAAKGWCSEKQARQALEIATLFPQVPAHLAAEIPGDNLVDMEKVPLNRRQRKRIAEAKSVTIHLFSGPQTSLWTCCEQEGHVVLCVELQKGLDMHNRALVSYLENLFRSGKVDLLLAGPPCRSVSLQRFREDNGPPPVRGRCGLMRFGLPLNTWANKQLCDQDTLLWLRLLWFCHIGVQANVNMEIGIEQPGDPEDYLPESRERPQYGFPSFLSWPETFTITETCGLRRVKFDQGSLGHPHRKPTEMLSSIPEVHTLDELRLEPGHEKKPWSDDLE